MIWLAIGIAVAGFFIGWGVENAGEHISNALERDQ